MTSLLRAGAFAAGMFAAAISATVATAQDTIRFAVTDIDGMEALQTEMGPFKDAFEAASC
jgi:phosphonate transport system substrate-binding protein